MWSGSLNIWKFYVILLKIYNEKNWRRRIKVFNNEIGIRDIRFFVNVERNQVENNLVRNDELFSSLSKKPRILFCDSIFSFTRAVTLQFAKFAYANIGA